MDEGSGTQTGSGSTTTSTHSDGTGDQGQNETQPSGGDGGDNQTGSGDQVENDTGGLQNDNNLTGTNELHFALVGVNSSIPGRGGANVQFEGTSVQVDGHIHDGYNNTSYTLILTLNGTSHNVGTFVTDEEGEGEVEGNLDLNKTGTYVVSVSLMVGHSTVMNGSPATQTAVAGEHSSQEDDQGDNNNQGDSVTVGQLDQSGSDALGLARTSGQIPGEVNFDGSNAQVSVSDSKFAIGAGALTGRGLSITISGSNVQGSRVLLVDLSRGYDLSRTGLRLTFDGQLMSESSLAQVLSITPAGKPTFAVVGAPSGYLLLIAIPHFSTHSIVITPITTSIAGALVQVSGYALLVAMLAIGAAVLVTYSRRKAFSPFA